MNSLSLLLYLIYGLNAISVLLVVAGVVLLAFTGISTVMTIGWYNGWDHYQPADNEKGDWWKIRAFRYGRYLVFVVLVFAAIPDNRTVKLIAASEVAEYLINTEAGQTVLDEASKTVGKSGAIIGDSLELLHVYIKNELSTLTAELQKPEPQSAK